MPRRPVWARKQVALDTCPKPYITAESHSLLEEFFVWRQLGVLDGETLSARHADAFAVLEKELAAERNDSR